MGKFASPCELEILCFLENTVWLEATEECSLKKKCFQCLRAIMRKCDNVLLTLQLPPTICWSMTGEILSKLKLIVVLPLTSKESGSHFFLFLPPGKCCLLSCCWDSIKYFRQKQTTSMNSLVLFFQLFILIICSYMFHWMRWNVFAIPMAVTTLWDINARI